MNPMPPVDAAPDPPDRPAEALWYEFESFCWEGANADRFGSRGGLWLPSCPWYGLLDWQRDLARRLAAAALAAGREQPDAGGATMTAEDLSEAVIRHLQDMGCVTIPDAADGLTLVLAAAFREAEAAAAARQREADAAACRAVLEFWASDSPAPDPYEAGAVAAAEMCAERIMRGDAGGGGAGGA